MTRKTKPDGQHPFQPSKLAAKNWRPPRQQKRPKDKFRPKSPDPDVCLGDEEGENAGSGYP
jgi:hypothetical protein